MTPLEIVTATFAIANGTFTLALSFWKLHNVDDDLKICLRLLAMIRADINEARELRNRKFGYETSSDSLLASVNSKIEDLDTSAIEIGKTLEASRVEKALRNRISVAKRVAWVFNGKDAFNAQQWVVTAAHARLLQVTTCMRALPDFQTDAVAPPAYEKVALKRPGQIRASEGKNTVLLAALDPPAYEKAPLRSPGQFGGVEGKTTATMAATKPPAPYEEVPLKSPSHKRASEGKSTAIIAAAKPPASWEEVALKSPSQVRASKGKSTAIIEVKNESSNGKSSIFSWLRPSVAEQMLR